MSERLTKEELQALGWMHIYAQYEYHTPATIRGTKEALAALRDALTVAIEKGKGEAIAFAADGEGYAVEIQRINVVNFLGRLPYTSPYFRDLP